MKKNEAPHSLQVSIGLADKTISGKCSCVAGISRYCHHYVALSYLLPNLNKILGMRSLPDDLTCTSMQQRWSIPRGKNYTSARDLGEFLLFKRADYNKFIKSTLYSPSSQYNVLTKEHFNGIEPNPLIVSLFPKKDQASSLPVVPCKFGNVPKGSILSYQQKFTEEYVINDFTCTAFPILPLDGAVNRYENNIAICLTANNKQP
ncbi:unnamed protein product [Pocillopora meandrina]|uniref:SWIM-type domain-containing protein n=1 Tax=Pocillopora meandrina TaxID=46732 RepID=A0AAU9X411_9CNID|nr:unnamed protein product [Pocillopora meandrina]